MFGLAPALAATRLNVQETLRDASRATAGRGRQYFRKSMVVAEVAVALVLLVSAGLMADSLRKMAKIDLGFQPENVLAWSIFLPATEYNAAQALEFHQRALEKISALPGVESATVASSLPLSDPTMEVPFDLESAARGQSERPGVSYASIGPGYLRTLGIALKRGRDFTAADDAKAPPVAIVNEAFAARYFPGRTPVGQRLVLNRPTLGGEGFQPATHVEIVGLIANVTLGHLAADATPILYVPHAQDVWRRTSWFAVRTRSDPRGIAPAVRQAMADLDKNQLIENLGPMQQTFSRKFAEPRFQAQLMGAFAVLALLLAAAGIYGINAHSVAERRREIGLRMALGASPRKVLRDTIGEGLKLTLCGIAAGIAGSLALASILRSVLVGVSPTDPPTLAGVALFLGIVAAAACYVPARRATRIDPAIVLRQE
ncbi:MAG TPA: FtsX-like permease family protein [Bryobacteraceae bacterium]|nr:FtsX-like permease family protein [Bryobacteraceae bacterium]